MSLDRAPQAGLPIILEAYKDTSEHVRQAALEALSKLFEVSPAQAQAALPIILEAYKDTSEGVRQAAQAALSKLLEVSPAQAQAALPIILEAHKDTSEGVRQAAQAALSKLLEVSPAQAQEVLPLIQKALKDTSEDVRQAAFKALSKLCVASPERTQEVLPILLAAAEDENEGVRQTALDALLRASLEQLLESYWSSKDASLIPYITPRLYETPLVVGERPRGLQQVTLYATAGNPCEWKEPQEAVDHFKELVNTEARQIGETTTDYDGGLSKRAKGLWQRYFGEVSAAPPLPDDIVQIMESPCPFWKGKQVKDTHLLALIPSRVGGQPLTLDYLGELIKSPKGGGPATQYAYYWDEARKAIGNQSPERSYWVLMTRDVLDGSRSKSYQDQCALVADHASRTGLPYEVPGALEAAVVVLLHHVRSGERLYSDEPSTYTRCRESVSNRPLVVGGFSSGGLDVYDFSPFFYGYHYGVSALRKF